MPAKLVLDNILKYLRKYNLHDLDMSSMWFAYLHKMLVYRS